MKSPGSGECQTPTGVTGGVELQPVLAKQQQQPSRRQQATRDGDAGSARKKPNTKLMLIAVQFLIAIFLVLYHTSQKPATVIVIAKDGEEARMLAKEKGTSHHSLRVPESSFTYPPAPRVEYSKSLSPVEEQANFTTTTTESNTTTMTSAETKAPVAELPETSAPTDAAPTPAPRSPLDEGEPTTTTAAAPPPAVDAEADATTTPRRVSAPNYAPPAPTQREVRRPAARRGRTPRPNSGTPVTDHKMPGVCDCEQPKEQFDGKYNPSRTTYTFPDGTMSDPEGFAHLLKEYIKEGKQLRIALLGDSLTRQMFTGFVDRIETLNLLPNTPKLDLGLIHKKTCQIRYPEANFDASPIQIYYRMCYYPSHHAHLESYGLLNFKPTHVIVTRGLWDLKPLRPRSPAVGLRNFPALFTNLRNRLGNNTRIFYMSMPFHFASREGCKHLWGDFDCATTYDQEAFRSGLYCAVRRANNDGARVEHFNLFQMTIKAGLSGTNGGDCLHMGWPVLRVATSAIIELMRSPPEIIPPLPSSCPLAEVELGAKLPNEMQEYWDNTISCKPHGTAAGIFEHESRGIKNEWLTQPGLGIPLPEESADQAAAPAGGDVEGAGTPASSPAQDIENRKDLDLVIPKRLSPLAAEVINACSYFHGKASEFLVDWTFALFTPEQCARDSLDTEEEKRIAAVGGASPDVKTMDCPPTTEFPAHLYPKVRFCIQQLNRVDQPIFDNVVIPWGFQSHPPVLGCTDMYWVTHWHEAGPPLMANFSTTYSACIRSHPEGGGVSHGRQGPRPRVRRT